MAKEYYNLELLRIHELRDLARKMGVKSPTTLKREELISEINKIMSGEAKPYIKANKQGRPPRNQSNKFNTADILVPNFDEFVDADLRPYSHLEDNYVWEIAMPQAAYTAATEENIKNCEGCVDISAKGFGVLRKKDFIPRAGDIYISPMILTKYNLKRGDFISGSCNKVSCDKPEVLVEVNEYNVNKKHDFDAIKVYSLGNKVVVDEIKDFRLGGRYQVEVALSEKTEIINNLALKLKKNKNVEIRILLLNSSYDMNFDNLNETTFIPFNVRDIESVMATELYIESLKREVETGKNIVLIVDSLSQFAKNYNSVVNNDVMHSTISPTTLHKVKELISVSKCIDNNASLSIINVDSFIVPTSIKSMFEYEINPLFNN